jgi:hypothetical protein
VRTEPSLIKPSGGFFLPAQLFPIADLSYSAPAQNRFKLEQP